MLLLPPLDDAGLRLLLLAAAWVLAIGACAVVYRRWRLLEIARQRVWAEDDALDLARADIGAIERQGWLGRKLYLAGYRSRQAPASFVAACVASVLLGLAITLSLTEAGIVDQAVAAATSVPGGLGDLARPVLVGAPWILLTLFVMLPWALLSSARRRRLEQIEQDMPVTLEMLATMSESGLSFDGALNKVVETNTSNRPLFQELRTFVVESLSGVPRVQCFRRLSRRIELPAMNVFVSALVQAEQIGSGFTRVLRIQADDLRGRRREEANMLAQSLTVKLVFPLVLCFLPAIFVSTLGPTFLQFLKITESLTRGS
jgi:tight adherence protein C